MYINKCSADKKDQKQEFYSMYRFSSVAIVTFYFLEKEHKKDHNQNILQPDYSQAMWSWGHGG